MANIIGVQFQTNGKLYYYGADQLHPKAGDYVIVNTPQGIDLARVCLGSFEMEDEKAAASLKHIVRIATEQDIQHGADNRLKEKEAYTICQDKIREHKLEMKLVSVEYSFDNSKILFYFTANGRIDFRSLVKDLASVFKTRIELRQIGVRDEAKMLGGLGPCGRAICCGSFLDGFQPVSIKMAKEQNLSLNPTKISGVCGRLMCCLKYEQDHYEQARKRMPRIGREVSTPDGIGTVTDLNILKETVQVRITKGDDSETKIFSLSEISREDGTPTLKSQPAGQTSDAMVNKIFDEEPKNDEAETVLQEEDLPDMRPASANILPQSKQNRRNNGKNLQEKSENNKTDDDKPSLHRMKNRHVLGQPVRRENTKKNQNLQILNADKKQETASQKEQQTKKKQVPKQDWAGAVENAIRAIDRN